MKHLRFTLAMYLVVVLCGSELSGKSGFMVKEKSGTITPERIRTATENVIRNAERSKSSRSESAAAIRMVQRNATARVIAERELKLRAPDARITWNEKTNTPIFVEGNRLATPANALMAIAPGHMESITQQFLSEYSAVLGMRDAAHEFEIMDQSVDQRGFTHVHLQQTYRGVSVWGADARTHVDAEGNLVCFNGRYIPTPSSIVSVEATVPAAMAAATAERELISNGVVNSLTMQEKGLLGYAGPETEKVIFSRELTIAPRLAWHVTVRPNIRDRWEYFVDAQSGAVLFNYYNTCSDGPATATSTDLNGQPKTIHSYQLGSKYYLIDASRPMFDAAGSTFPDEGKGVILTISANNTDLANFFHITSTNNTWSDATAVSAHDNSGKTYEYYRTTHNRNSLDDKGMTMISVIHVTSGGQGMDNAFWNGKFMQYGDGKDEFKPLAGSLDAAAHEISHGVTEYTSNLVYLSQSGALNESMSDVFGCMVDRDDWRIGEDVTKPGVFASGALRDLQDPHNGTTRGNNGWQPASMSEYETLPETRDGDNGGVHVNSGIPNHAAYLTATQLTREKAEQIYYCAQKNYLTKTSQFIDARLALARCAKELYGTAEESVVKSAWDAVGVTDGSGSGGPKDIPANIGDEWVLATNYAVTPTFDNSLYRIRGVATPQASDIQQVSSTQVLDYSRPSVTDDGLLAVWVDAQNNLYLAGLMATPVVTELDNTGVWGSCASSRDGNRLAATTSVADASIYVYDFAQTPVALHTFKLYTPTTGQGEQDNVVQYAGQMDWDPSGEYIMYDTFNRVVSQSGDTIEYWDINYLHAWDNAKNDFADGLVQRIFPPPEQGINIGNPIFSKNSPYIIAFDLEDLSGAVPSYAILGANLQTGDVAKITDNNMIGFPSYSRLDNIIAFNSEATGSVPVLSLVSVDASKIVGSSAPVVWINSGAWMPVQYTVGIRNDVREDGESPVADLRLALYPEPINGQGQLTVSSLKASSATIVLSDVLGRRVADLWSGILPAGDHVIPLDVPTVPDGIYHLTVQTARSTRSRLVSIVH